MSKTSPLMSKTSPFESNINTLLHHILPNDASEEQKKYAQTYLFHCANGDDKEATKLMNKLGDIEIGTAWNHSSLAINFDKALTKLESYGEDLLARSGSAKISGNIDHQELAASIQEDIQKISTGKSKDIDKKILGDKLVAYAEKMMDQNIKDQGAKILTHIGEKLQNGGKLDKQDLGKVKACIDNFEKSTKTFEDFDKKTMIKRQTGVSSHNFDLVGQIGKEVATIAANKTKAQGTEKTEQKVDRKKSFFDKFLDKCREICKQAKSLAPAKNQSHGR